MKYIKYLFLGIVVSALMISCESEENNPPSDDPRENLVETWHCEEESQIFGTSTYSLSIEIDEYNDDNVVIYNFYQLGAQMYLVAKLNGTNLTISNQTIDNNTVSGSGIIINNFKRIEWDYYVDDGSSIDTVSSVYIL